MASLQDEYVKSLISSIESSKARLYQSGAYASNTLNSTENVMADAAKSGYVVPDQSKFDTQYYKKTGAVKKAGRNDLDYSSTWSRTGTPQVDDKTREAMFSYMNANPDFFTLNGEKLQGTQGQTQQGNNVSNSVDAVQNDFNNWLKSQQNGNTIPTLSSSNTDSDIMNAAQEVSNANNGTLNANDVYNQLKGNSQLLTDVQNTLQKRDSDFAALQNSVPSLSTEQNTDPIMTSANEVLKANNGNGDVNSIYDSLKSNPELLSNVQTTLAQRDSEYNSAIEQQKAQEEAKQEASQPYEAKVSDYSSKKKSLESESKKLKEEKVKAEKELKTAQEAEKKEQEANSRISINERRMNGIQPNLNSTSSSKVEEAQAKKDDVDSRIAANEARQAEIQSNLKAVNKEKATPISDGTSFAPATGVTTEKGSSSNISADDASANMKAALADIKALNSKDSLNSEEKKRAKSLISTYNNARASYISALEDSGQNIPSMFDYENGTNDSAVENLQKRANTNKVSNFFQGVFNGLGFPSLQKAGAAIDSKLAKARGNEDAAKRDQDEIQNLTNNNEQAKKESPILHGAGNIAGQMYGYALANGIGDAAGLTGAINKGVSSVIKNQKAASALSNMATGQIADTVMDTVPTEINNAVSGMSAGAVAKDTLKNQVVNAAFNAGGEAAGIAFDKLKSILKGSSSDAVKTVESSAENITKNAPIADNSIKDANSIIDNTNVAKKAQNEAKSAIEGDIPITVSNIKEKNLTNKDFTAESFNKLGKEEQEQAAVNTMVDTYKKMFDSTSADYQKADIKGLTEMLPGSNGIKDAETNAFLSKAYRQMADDSPEIKKALESNTDALDAFKKETGEDLLSTKTSSERLLDAKNADVEHSKAYEDVVDSKNTYEDNLKKYTQSKGKDIDYDTLEKSFKDMQNSKNRLKTVLNNQNGSKESVKEAQKNIADFKNENGSTFLISNDALDSLKRGNQSRAKALEGVNKSLEKTGISFTTDANSVYDTAVSDAKSLYEKAKELNDNLYTAKHPTSELDDIVKTSKKDYSDIANARRVVENDTVPSLLDGDNLDANIQSQMKKDYEEVANMTDEEAKKELGNVSEKSVSSSKKSYTSAAAKKDSVPSLDDSETFGLDFMTPEERKASNKAAEKVKSKEQDMAYNAVGEGQKTSKSFATQLKKAEKDNPDLIPTLNKNKSNYTYDVQKESEMAAKSEAKVRSDIKGTYNKMLEKNADEMDAQDVHDMFTVKATYEKMAKQAQANGDYSAATLYKNKAVTMGYTAQQKLGTKSAQNLAAFKVYSGRTAEGALSKGDKIFADTADKFAKENSTAARGIDDLAQKLSDIMKKNNAEEVFANGTQAQKDALRSDMYDGIQKILKDEPKQTQKALKGLSEETINEVLLNDNAAAMAKQLDFFAESGGLGVKQSTIDKVTDIYGEMSELNYNSKEYYKKEQEAYKLLANDLAPKGGSFGDKVDEWRYLCMLGNPKTHIKNIAGNVTMNAIVGTKNTMSAMIESVADRISKVTGGNGIERTKSILTPSDNALVKAASNDANENAFRSLTGAKYSDEVGISIDNAIAAFNTKTPSGKLLNKLSDMNSGALDAEDTAFLKQKYSTSLAGYLKGNGADKSIFDGVNNLSEGSKSAVEKYLRSYPDGSLKNSKEFTDTQMQEGLEGFLQEARDYSINQAQEATFHQTNTLATSLSKGTKEAKQYVNPDNSLEQFSRNAVGTAADIILPFKKTPANILQTCFEYSPVGMANVAKDIKQVSRGSMKASKLIDDIAKVSTGTGGMMIGAALANEGILKIGADKSDKRTKFDAMTGQQAVSIKVGDKYINISELTPSAMPVVLGGICYDSFNKNSDSKGMDAFFNCLAATANTTTDMTMLSGLADTLNSVRYSDSDASVYAALGEQIGSNAASQFLPTIGSAIERTADSTKRSTYTDKQGTIGSVISDAKYLETKVPGPQNLADEMSKSSNENVSYIASQLVNEPAIDAWGRVKKQNGDSIGSRAANNFLNPLSVTTDKSDATEIALRALNDSTGEDGVFPNTATSEAKINAEDGQKILTPKEWTEYQKAKGSTSYNLAKEFTSSKYYKSLSDNEKAEVVKDLYSFSKTYNQSKYGRDIGSAEKKATIYESEGAKGLVEYEYKSNRLNSAGISASEKNIELYDSFSNDAEFQKAATAISGAGLSFNQDNIDFYNSNGKSTKALKQYATAIKNAGTTATDAQQKLYEEMGASNYVDYSQTLDNNGLKSSEKASKVYENMEDKDDFDTYASLKNQLKGKRGKNAIIPVLDNTDMSESEKAEMYNYLGDAGTKNPYTGEKIPSLLD